jgi:hypothetical protein
MALARFENRQIVQRPAKMIRTERPKDRYVLGTGAPPNIDKIKAAGSDMALKRAGFGSILDAMNEQLNTPYYNMDVIEQVRWTMAGPQSDASITENFGSTIDLFGSGKAPTDIDFVETTMAQTGQTQTFFVACYVGFHMEPEPLCFTARGNACTHPTTDSLKPPSPDVWTINDLFNGALGAPFAGGSPAQAYTMAIMRHGWWANYAAWHMARAYNYRWKIGQHVNIMDEQLRHTAYMPPSAQEGSASSSEVDLWTFVNNMNRRYDSMGSALDFLPIDFLRIGSDGNPAVEVPNIGRFVPTRDFEIIGATYGGMDLRSMLRGNSEMRKLCIPYVISPGVPIGIILQECDNVQGNAMRQFLSITGNLGGSIPPAFTPEDNWTSPTLSGLSPVMLERTLGGADVPQQVDAQRALFESGEFKITLPIRGFEVSRDWYNQLSSDADVRNAVFECVGVRFAMQ